MFNDIILINQKLMQIDFDSMSLDDKKKALSSELMKYLNEKIVYNTKKKKKKQLSPQYNNIYEIMEEIDRLLPYEERESIGKLIQFILSVASEIQGSTITWKVLDREDLRDCPEISFNSSRGWSAIVSYENDDILKVFYFVYEMFMDNFTVKTKKENRNEFDSDTLRLLFKRR